MKLSELIDILEQYDSSEDVVIASNQYPGFTARTDWRPDNYLHFIVTEHRWQSCAKGSCTIAELEMTDAIIGYLKPFATRKN
jgi:hypothetical protein